jgi:hypothetical protein
MSRRTIYRKLEKLGIETGDYDIKNPKSQTPNFK